MEFSKETCQCKPAIHTQDIQVEEKAERSYPEPFFTLEHYVIIILSFLLLILLLIILFLAIRIQRLKTFPSSTPLASAFSENLYTQCPVNEKGKENNSISKT